MISFGPIPSRRLGKSLGINNIPAHKKCTYSCIYCQVGLTKKYTTTRLSLYQPSIIYTEVKTHLQKLNPADRPDFLTFVANGEPMLDIHLGQSIKILQTLNIPIAVITNASLLSHAEVRDELSLANWVSVKVDANNPEVWKKINNPHPMLSFSNYTHGLQEFASQYKGKLVTETMLVEGINDSEEQLNETAKLVASLHPSVAYISIPTRPPAQLNVKPSSEKAINNAYQIFTQHKLNTELILGFEGSNTGFTGNAIDDILNICTVHPIREDTMLQLLKKNNATPDVLHSLIHNQYITKINYNSKAFYIRKFHV